MTRADVAYLLAAITATWPRFVEGLENDVVDLMPSVWFDALGDISREDAADAIAVHRAASKWPPTIADLRRIVAERAAPARRSGAEAWGDVQAAIQRWGADRVPRFSDPLVRACVISLGWRHLCLSTSPAADRARFCEAYDAMDRASAAQAVLPAPLRRLPQGPARTLGGPVSISALLGGGKDGDQ